MRASNWKWWILYCKWWIGYQSIIIKCSNAGECFDIYAGCQLALSPPVSRGRTIAKKAYRLHCQRLRIIGTKVKGSCRRMGLIKPLNYSSQRTLSQRGSHYIVFTRLLREFLSLCHGSPRVLTYRQVVNPAGTRAWVLRAATTGEAQQGSYRINTAFAAGTFEHPPDHWNHLCNDKRPRFCSGNFTVASQELVTRERKYWPLLIYWLAGTELLEAGHLISITITAPILHLFHT